MEAARIVPSLIEAMHVVHSEQRRDSRTSFRINWSGLRVSTRMFRTIIPDSEFVRPVAFSQHDHAARAPRHSALSDERLAYSTMDQTQHQAGLTEAEIYMANTHNRRTVALWDSDGHEDEELLLPEQKKEKESSARNIISECSKEREQLCSFIDASQDAPSEFNCPITLQAMRIPVVSCDGHSYDKNAIIAHYRSKPYKSPITNVAVNSEALFPNYSVASLMESLVASNSV